MINLPIVRKPEMVKPDKVIKTVYCLYRVSTKNQVDDCDIPMQRTACREFASQQYGWVIKKEFKELGVSGFKVSVDERDKIQELKLCAERKEFDVLLVFMFDRLGRRDDETPFVLRWFTENGIEVWSVKEGQQIFDSCVDDLINYVRFWTAKTESYHTSLRVRTRLAQMVAEGKYTGGNVPYGYHLVPSGETNKHGRMLMKLEVVPQEAEIVKLIFRKTTIEGIGSHVLATIVNDLGIRSHGGAAFQSNTINRILKNPIFCGFYYRSGVLSPRQNELQIIDDETYNEAQRILNGRAKKSSDNVPFRSSGSALLVGNAFCGCCNMKLVLTTHTYSHKTADGQVHWTRVPRYMCAGRTQKRNNCTGQGTFVAKRVDANVEDYLCKLNNSIQKSSTEEMIQCKYEKVLDRLKSQTKAYEEQEELLSNQIKVMYAEVPDSIMGKSAFTPEVLSEVIAELRNQLNDVQMKLEQLRSERYDSRQLQSSIRFRLEELKRMLKRFFENDVKNNERKMIANKLLDRVIIQRGTKEKYDITYYMRDDFSDFVDG